MGEGPRGERGRVGNLLRDLELREGLAADPFDSATSPSTTRA